MPFVWGVHSTFTCFPRFLIPFVFLFSHDWGSQICYEAGRSRPDVFEAVVGVAIPVRPSTLIHRLDPRALMGL